MPRQILVRVKPIIFDEHGRSTNQFGEEDTITYKAYLHTQEKYQLIAQVDENGKQVFDSQGNPNPNLNPEHRQTRNQSDVDHAADVRESTPTLIQNVQQEVKVEQPRRGRPRRNDVNQHLEEFTA